MNENLIVSLKDIVVEFDGEKVLDGLSLDIHDKEFVTFLGPSGCGKTTTLRVIAGFITPKSGNVFFDGEDIADLPPYKRQVNTVFQKYALFPHLNVFENVAFALRLKKLPEEEIKSKVLRMLEIVGLKGYERRNTNQLSGGQQQRVAIARSLINQPRVLLLDEPLGALDLKLRKQMQLELKRLQRELNITFIYVTHDQEEALTMSDKIVVMNNGKIQQIGTPEDIYNEPINVFVADFIGESNIFNGIMTGKMKARFCGTEWTCVDDVPEGTHITAVVRPEDVILTKPGEGGLDGVVTSVIFKGIHYEIAVESGKNEIVIQTVNSANVGDRVGMHVDPDNIHIMLAEENTNVFTVDINKNYRPEFNGTVLETSLTKIIKGSRRNEDGALLDASGSVIDPARIHVRGSIQPSDIVMTDNVDEGLVQGNITNLIYEGDHYRYVVHTDLGQDFVVSDEYLWNMGDMVGLIMPVEKMSFEVRR